MEVKDRGIWQIAAGDTDRSYVDLFLRWDVVANGPGRAGGWPKCEQQLRATGWTGKAVAILRRFCEEMKVGDLVVLRLGTSEIYGVGEIASEPLWLDDFGDIDGWDLQHVRRVKWHWKSVSEPRRFPTHTLRWGDTVQRVQSSKVVDWIAGLSEADADGSVVELPGSCVDGEPREDTRKEAIGEYLFDQGTAADRIDSLIAEMDELIRIAKWYARAKHPPSEHETVAYLVVPLLRALGWTPQKMAIEWNRVDVALFDRMPRADKNLVVAVEAKRMNWSCLTAHSQAAGYATRDGRESCRRLIVTDGLRYATFLRDANGHFRDYPHAYLNLTRMRDKYPILRCGGAKDSFLVMAPDWQETAALGLCQDGDGEPDYQPTGASVLPDAITDSPSDGDL